MPRCYHTIENFVTPRDVTCHLPICMDHCQLPVASCQVHLPIEVVSYQTTSILSPGPACPSSCTFRVPVHTIPNAAQYLIYIYLYTSSYATSLAFIGHAAQYLIYIYLLLSSYLCTSSYTPSLAFIGYERRELVDLQQWVIS